MRSLPLLFIPISIPAIAFGSAKDEAYAQERFKDKVQALELLLSELKEADTDLEETPSSIELAEVAKQEPESIKESSTQEKAAIFEKLLQEETSLGISLVQQTSEEEGFLEEEYFEWDEEKRLALKQNMPSPVAPEEPTIVAAENISDENKALNNPKTSSQTTAPSDSKPNLYPIPKRIDISHNQGFNQRSNFGTDYSTVAMLLASDYVQGRVMPMIDLRAHHFDNNRYAANVGVGGRYIPYTDSFCELLGFNAYYDFRQGAHGNYNQIGLGIEVLAKRWEFRANAYFPVGVKRHKTKCEFTDYLGDFFVIHRRCEFTAYGYNAEVGYYPINGHTFSLYTAVGPYYLLRRCEHNTIGGLARARAQYRDYLALEGRVSYDPVFKTVYQLILLLRLPLYQIFTQKNRKTPCGMYERQVYQPVERFEIMPLGKRSCWERNF